MLKPLKMPKMTGRVKTLFPSVAPITQAVLDIWNTPEIMVVHHCHAFALGALGGGMTSPGRISKNTTGEPESAQTPLKRGWLRAALLKDGLKQIRRHDADPKKNHIMAAFEPAFLENTDYHFRRLSSCGQWFEKHGDSETRPIELSAKRYGYNDPPNMPYRMIGFFMLPASGIEVFYPEKKAFAAYARKRARYEQQRERRFRKLTGREI